MKRTIIAASLFLSAICVSAQQESGLTIQPKIGLNIANYTNSDNSDPRIGIAAGLELEHYLTKNFSLSTGLIYSMQGAKESGTYQGSQATVTSKTDYINIPILANVYLAKGLSVKFGLQPGLNVNSSYEVSTQGISVSGSLSDMHIDINTFDLSIPVGLSFEYKHVVIDGRYNIGVTKMVDRDDSKNSVIQLTLGYKFGL
ncbi:MAG: PorT family protein [Prevotella sp.]|nr:PorT family protein [Prevotella sp.]